MSIITDIINLNVNINGNQARKALNDLNKESADVKASMVGLKKTSDEYLASQVKLVGIEDKMSALRKEIGLTSLTMKDLSSSRRQLQAILSSTIPDTAEFKKYEAELVAVIARQKELRTGINSFNSVRISTASITRGITALAASYLGFTAVISGIRSLITGSIKLSDQLGDLRRVAGLTADEANNLNHALLQIDTRTSGAGLLSIAIIAGKLGVAKQDIFSFTEAVNKLVVTLGDELGDADNITTQLGKILNVFDGTITGDNITHLGNAIVDLANKGVATGPFIVDFTQRVSGIAKASGISLGATLGLAAGFEGLGLRSQSSATALQKLLITISTDLPKAAGIAGIPLAEFNKLFADQPQEALLKYAQGLVKNKAAFAEIATSFKDAGEEGARVVSTLLAIGQNSEYVQKQIDIGNTSIKEQTALNTGFAIKNDNLAGSIEKLSKEFDKLVANNRVQTFLKGIVNVISGAIDGVNKLIDSFDSFEEKAHKANVKADKDQIVFAKRIVEGAPATATDPGFIGMSQKTVDEQQKMADSYKQIYISSRKQLAEFLNSSDKDNQRRRHELINQVAQDGRTFVATQEQIKKATAEQKDKTKTTPLTAPGGDTNSDYDSILKQAQAFYKKLQELKFGAEQASKSDDQKEIDAVKHKYEEIFIQYDALQKKLNKQDRGILGPRGDISADEEKELAALTAKQKQAAFEKDQKQQQENLTKEYDAKKQQETLFYEGQKEVQGKRFADGEIDYKTFQANLAAIDVKSNAALLQNAEDFAKLKVTINGKVVAAVEEAEKDMTAFEKAEFEKRIANAIRAALAKEAEIKLLRNLDNQAEISKANTKVIVADASNNPKAQAAAQKDLLDLQLKQKNTALDQEAIDAKKKLQETGADRVAKEKQIDDDIQAQRDEADKDHAKGSQDADNKLYQARIQMAQSFADTTISLFTSLNQALNNIEDRKLQKVIARNNKEKAALQTQLDHKLISQKQYDKKVAILDAAADAEKLKISIQQAKRQKALDIFEAITGTAAAVVGALGSKPYGPWNIALAALVGTLGAVQIGVIASEPLPTATAAEGNWFRTGDKHSDPSGGIPVMIERDEAVVKAKAMTDKNNYTVSGTPAQITSKLNSMHGGINWAGGASIQPKFREPAPQINPRMSRIMAEGGLGSGITDNIRNESSALLQQMVLKIDELTTEVKSQKTQLHAVVSIKEYREKEKQYDNAKKAAGMGG